LLLKLEILVELLDHVQLVIVKAVLVEDAAAFSTQEYDISVNWLALVLLLVHRQ
jgi:hypothetical protein